MISQRITRVLEDEIMWRGASSPKLMARVRWQLQLIVFFKRLLDAATVYFTCKLIVFAIPGVDKRT